MSATSFPAPCTLWLNRFAMPKSMTLSTLSLSALPLSWRRKFSGFKSLWQMPGPMCRCEMTENICPMMEVAFAKGRGRFSPLAGLSRPLRRWKRFSPPPYSIRKMRCVLEWYISCSFTRLGCRHSAELTRSMTSTMFFSLLMACTLLFLSFSTTFTTSRTWSGALGDSSAKMEPKAPRSIKRPTGMPAISVGWFGGRLWLQGGMEGAILTHK
mmetsp:Transcript_243/g.735  ORF Transcript_243/g.735 Transcript_243/m.735 type:complete len:212 (+) Transcript_243:931-1566(+)